MSDTDGYTNEPSDSYNVEPGFTSQVRNMSTAPGVYIFKDRQGKTLYVGKAKNLRKRLQSYFQPGRPHDIKTSVLMTKVAALKTIITNTEKEALILESNLIKQHRPRYNIHLKDDKRYPFLRLNVAQPFPNLNIVRKIKNDGALYFGPYASSAAVRQTMKFIHKTFKLRKCRTKTFMSRSRPCLNYQMGLCLGPCCLDVDPKEYASIVDEVTAFLRGRTPALISKIKRQMETAAGSHNFEKAAVLRDKMFALEKTLEKQVTVATDFKDRDAVAMVSEGDISVFALLQVRGGFLLGGRQFVFEGAMGSPKERMSIFLRQLYSGRQEIPAQILVNKLPDDTSIIEFFLSEHRGLKAYVTRPRRGEKARLIELAEQNAMKGLKERLDQLSTNLDLLNRLKKRLQMEKSPQRIECFDNSNLAGSLPVSAMVVFEDGRARKEAYRHYKIKYDGKPDDYAHMAEVLTRRFKKDPQELPLPDLLLVDGGKGQLNIASAVLASLGLAGRFALAGIAKKDEAKGETDDKIYLPNRANPVIFGKDTDILLFLQRIRDEAHRSAIGYQRKRRTRSSLRSILDGIDGIGPHRKRSLLSRYGSIEQIRSAPIEDLCRLPGISQRLAALIKQQLGGNR